MPVQQLDSQTLNEERDALMDVYNYAARFSFVPEISIHKVQRMPRRMKSSVEVTIELKDQGIKVVARGGNLHSAEVAASIRFKEEAERYHARHGDETLVLKTIPL